MFGGDINDSVASPSPRTETAAVADTSNVNLSVDEIKNVESFTAASVPANLPVITYSDGDPRIGMKVNITGMSTRLRAMSLFQRPDSPGVVTISRPATAKSRSSLNSPTAGSRGRTGFIGDGNVKIIYSSTQNYIMYDNDICYDY